MTLRKAAARRLYSPAESALKTQAIYSMLVRYSAGPAYPIPIALRLFFSLSSSSSLLLLRLGPARGGGRREASASLTCGALNKNRLIPPPVLADPVPDGRVTGVLPPALPSFSLAPRLRRPFGLLLCRRGFGGGGGRWFLCPVPELAKFGAALAACWVVVAVLARARVSLRTGRCWYYVRNLGPLLRQALPTKRLHDGAGAQHSAVRS